MTTLTPGRERTRYLLRYKDSTRMNHWFVALLFVAAALSGLALFHPTLFFFSNLFGGGQLTRILHPFLGVLMVLGFIVLFFTVWRENLIGRADREWLRHAGEMLKGQKENMPAVGKYNAGQKLVFWAFAVSLLLLLVTGFMFWAPYFFHLVPVTLRRLAILVHSVSAVVLVLSVIVHVYAAIWVKGTTRAMTRGTVTEGWARLNHPLWHREMTEGHPPRD
ncbi:formate dehydrogenase subunit gamma [Aquincola tertiaricarbonis]|uniref:Formate dehydrogenase subunit gamma n=1 Tax=Aquincola tertiaricarbonis TaxID=391953 RepID=A0ABY4S5M5_AQUTE|nr:formate dehydrogenase subunit gamma [Aquincola tertiaricarbonis]URI08731.1 formate dehydrogenase subunit gamma [Aquincola tertiaricarbonis]